MILYAVYKKVLISDSIIRKYEMENEIRYYSDEVHDDFAGTGINTQPLPEDFKYHSKNPLAAIRRFIVYRIIATPATFLYTKLVKRIKYVNKKCMKGYKKQGCFIYGNHTAFVCDAFNPTVLSFPRPAKVMVNEDTTSIKGIRWVVLDAGALPIPSNLHLMSAFNDEIARAIDKKYWVAIYPEAHIWPYYTGLRNFPAVSFRYPVRLDTPVFSYTMTFSKRRHSKKPKITVYVDGPFFADNNLPLKKAQCKLRDEVYAAMKARTDAHSDYEYKYTYVRREEGATSEVAAAQAQPISDASCAAAQTETSKAFETACAQPSDDDKKQSV